MLSGTDGALDDIPRVKTKKKEKKNDPCCSGETCDAAFQSRSVMEEEDGGKESIVFDGRGEGSEDKEETQIQGEPSSSSQQSP